MVKVGIFTLASPDGGGVYQYKLSLMEALSKYSKKYEYIQIRYPDFPRFFENEVIINKQKSPIGLKIRRLLRNYTGIGVGNLSGIYKETFSHIDLIISPAITLLPYHMKKPYIVTMHDFQQEYYPEFFSLKERISRKIVYRTGKFARLIVVESRYVKDDVVKFLKVDEKKVRVLSSPPPSYLTKIFLIQSKSKEVQEKYKLPNRYLFYPAQFWYHKNHIKLLEALNLIKQKFGKVIPLILVGSKKNNFENVMRKIEEFGMQEQVRYLGYVPDEDMPYLYKLSTALVMPTLFESVSLPIWEAFYLGVPVVSSNVCGLPEQVGDAGLLFDPHNIEDMAEKIYKVWSDEKLQKELTEKGYKRINDLTLENYAKQWEEIIEEALKK